jgi:hypothetical protein
MGFSPESNAHLDFMFADYLNNKFPDLNIPAAGKEKYSTFHTKRSWE